MNDFKNNKPLLIGAIALSFCLIIGSAVYMIKDMKDTKKKPVEKPKIEQKTGLYTDEEIKKMETDYYSNPDAQVLSNEDGRFIKEKILNTAKQTLNFGQVEQEISKECKNYNSADSTYFKEVLQPMQEDAVLLANMPYDAPTNSDKDIAEIKSLIKEIHSDEMRILGVLALPMEIRAKLAYDQDAVAIDTKAPIKELDMDKQKIKLDIDGVERTFTFIIKDKSFIGLYPLEEDQAIFIKNRDFNEFYQEINSSYQKAYDNVF